MSTAAEGFKMRRIGEVEFTKPLERAMLRDSRLSFGARGLFSYLWDMPKNWCANATHLKTQSPAGRDAVIKMMKELETIGAMRYEEIRGGDGRLQGSVWVMVSPSYWAVKTPLNTIKNTKKPSPPKALKPRPANNSTEALKSRKPAAPVTGKTAAKGLRSKGFAIEKAEAESGQNSEMEAAAAFDGQDQNQPQLGSAHLEQLVAPFLKNPADHIRWDGIKDDFELDVVFECVKKIILSGKNPYPSSILKRLPKKPGPMISGGNVSISNEAIDLLKRTAAATAADLKAKYSGLSAEKMSEIGLLFEAFLEKANSQLCLTLRGTVCMSGELKMFNPLHSKTVMLEFGKWAAANNIF